MHTSETQPAPGRAELLFGSMQRCQAAAWGVSSDGRGREKGFVPCVGSSAAGSRAHLQRNPKKCNFGEGPACRVNAQELLPAFREGVRAGLGAQHPPRHHWHGLQEENISPCRAECSAGGAPMQQGRSHPAHGSAWPREPAGRGAGGGTWGNHIWAATAM